MRSSRDLHSESSKGGVSRFDKGEFRSKPVEFVSSRAAGEYEYDLHGLAARGVSSTGLAENCLAVAIVLQELNESLEHGNVVGGALRVGATVVAVEVLVN